MSGHIRLGVELHPTVLVGGLADVAPLMGWKPGRAFELSVTGLANVPLQLLSVKNSNVKVNGDAFWAPRVCYQIVFVEVTSYENACLLPKHWKPNFLSKRVSTDIYRTNININAWFCVYKWTMHTFFSQFWANK